MVGKPRIGTPTRLADIARAAGVSPSLVSKVLSGRMGSSQARPEVIANIRACAKRLGYVPNGAARALISCRQGAVGVFLAPVGQPESGLTARIVEGVAEGLAQRGLRMVLRFFQSEEDFAECLSIARPELVDGVLVGGGVHFDIRPAVREILSRGMPVATDVDVAPDPSVPNVSVDPSRVAEVAAAHLFSRGCRRLLCAAVAPGLGKRRIAGFHRAAVAAGLPESAVTIVRLPGYAIDAQGFLPLVEMAVGGAFDGVVATADPQAAYIVNHLVAAGIPVPDRIKVVGIDNSPGCAFASCSLTSVDGRNRQCAEIAVRNLCALIDGDSAESASVDPVIIPRAST